MSPIHLLYYVYENPPKIYIIRPCIPALLPISEIKRECDTSRPPTLRMKKPKTLRM